MNCMNARCLLLSKHGFLLQTGEVSSPHQNNSSNLAHAMAVKSQQYCNKVMNEIMIVTNHINYTSFAVFIYFYTDFPVKAGQAAFK
mmetsp:Transcript_9521/g.12521  ORF Transcript_9521/g.12521 Transcript_9521/m.12521 type:complete len:86 (-) Transcript_9521:690-947(-)